MLQGCVEIIYILIQGTIYCAIVYWMCWFQRDAGHSTLLAVSVQLALCPSHFLVRPHSNVLLPGRSPLRCPCGSYIQVQGQSLPS